MGPGQAPVKAHPKPKIIPPNKYLIYPGALSSICIGVPLYVLNALRLIS